MLFNQRRILTNGIELNIAEAAKACLFVHGFPESALETSDSRCRERGHHAVAMDMRGYDSDKPWNIESIIKSR